MSRDVNPTSVAEPQVWDAGQIAAALRATDCSACAVTVIGYGTMGRHYVKALRALRVRRIRVVNRSPERLRELEAVPEVTIVASDVRRLKLRPEPGELAILAVPVPELVAGTEHLIRLGFRLLLVEKPIALAASTIERLASLCEAQGVEAWGAFNRLAYPAFHEVKARATREGGITSVTYTMTEMIRPDWPQRFAEEELARWGVANSLHVASMAHGLIGLPKVLEAYQAGHGRLSWHPSGTVFVGAGISEQDIPFSYHADWGSKGRWSLEVHTAAASYRLCPLEQLFTKTDSLGEWQPVPVTAFAPEVKGGVVEEVASILQPAVREMIALPSLRADAKFVRAAEHIFGYTGDTR